ncbi:unnamed protein product [Microthlaspi erraticum]|uniref:Uncharacterized protein n=1 Tax=Microthlaspi erraticum TaxID=1685480 RepID=A0A6D2HX57_9BRAS|nr:unnamed protein product [Microthlaspi erraticum]
MDSCRGVLDAILKYALIEQFYEGEKYWMCDMYRFDSFLHHRKRWDTSVTEEIRHLKEQNEVNEKQIRELSFRLEDTEKKLGKEIEGRTQSVREVYDMIMEVVCACDDCKHSVVIALNMVPNQPFHTGKKLDTPE